MLRATALLLFRCHQAKRALEQEVHESRSILQMSGVAQLRYCHEQMLAQTEFCIENRSHLQRLTYLSRANADMLERVLEDKTSEIHQLRLQMAEKEPEEVGYCLEIGLRFVSAMSCTHGSEHHEHPQ